MEIAAPLPTIPEIKTVPHAANHAGIVANSTTLLKSASLPQLTLNGMFQLPSFNVSSGREAFKTCTLMIDEDSLQLLLNTRANVSLLNLERYRQFFSHQPLGTPSTALCGCANFKIDIVGSLQLPLKYGENLHCRHPVAATAPCTGMPLLLCTPAPD